MFSKLLECSRPRKELKEERDLRYDRDLQGTPDREELQAYVWSRSSAEKHELCMRQKVENCE
jgi:hypothetical protein